MASNSVSTVYLNVIDDVISKVRDEFIDSGAGEAVLNELQQLWEFKMMQCGAISGTIERPSVPRPAVAITPVHDLNVPYEGPGEEYETPTAEMLFPPTPLQTPLPGTAQTPLPGTVQSPFPGTAQTPLPGSVQTPLSELEQSMYDIPSGPSDYSPVNDTRNGRDLKAGRQSLYMQSPSPWMNKRLLGVDVNVAYVEGHEEVEKGTPHQPMTQDFLMMTTGKRKREDHASLLTSGGYIPQSDGSSDAMIELFLPKTSLDNNSATGGIAEDTTATLDKQAKEILMLPQADGVHDEYNVLHFQGVATEDYNTPTPADHAELRAGTPSVGTPKPAKYEPVDDEEPPLNEDDDDDDDLDDLELGEEELNTHHLILAQFEKVTRTKSRWKCTLKDGIMHINNRDILFNKATGEFDF